MRKSLGFVCLILACGGSSSDENTSSFSSSTQTAGTQTGTATDATTGSGATSTASTSVDGTADTTADSGSDGGPPKLDVGTMPDIGGGGGDGCEKIDFLFVIDNSNSMSDEQQLLIDAFPGFVDTIQQTLPEATDFHIGITKTDIFGFDDNPTPDPTNPCAYELGGLLSHETDPGQKSGIGADCNFASGASYMTNTATLADEFTCAAYVGTEGNTGERQAEATLAALSAQKAQPGECSEGFIRSDALLVLVVITDEDDDWSEPDADAATNAQAWFDGVVAAKGDIETNVVFLLVSGGSPKWPTCPPLDLQTMTGADDSPKLTAWASLFTNHELGNVCEEGYETYLADAIATIETACDEFTPEG